MKKVLITGGAGYLGLNMAVTFLENGRDVVIVDDLKNAFDMHINRLVSKFEDRVSFFVGDACDYEFMDNIFSSFEIDTVIHLSAYKYVGESIHKAQEYFDNNIGSLENILRLSSEYKISKFAFASSAVVYGNTDIVPTTEDVKFAPLSPYAETKCIGEDIIQKWCQKSGISAVIFRFSNPVGANVKYMFGDHSKKGVENLLPYIVRSAIEDKAMVFKGNNHTTPDGTPIRDYISIVDLADIVVQVLTASQSEKLMVLNVGKGSGYSLLEIVGAVEKVLGKKVKYSFAQKNDLEASVSVLDTSKLNASYNIKLKYNLEDIVKSQIEFYNFINKSK